MYKIYKKILCKITKLKKFDGKSLEQNNKKIVKMHKIKKFFCEILQNCKKPIAILKKRCYNKIVVKR